MAEAKKFWSPEFDTLESHHINTSLTQSLGSTHNDTSVRLWAPKLVRYKVESDTNWRWNWMGGQIEEFWEPTQCNQDDLYKWQESLDSPVTVQSQDVLVQDEKPKSGQSWKRTITQNVERIARRAIQTVRNLHGKKRRQR